MTNNVLHIVARPSLTSLPLLSGWRSLTVALCGQNWPIYHVNPLVLVWRGISNITFIVNHFTIVCRHLWLSSFSGNNIISKLLYTSVQCSIMQSGSLHYNAVQCCCVKFFGLIWYSVCSAVYLKCSVAQCSVF